MLRTRNAGTKPRESKTTTDGNEPSVVHFFKRRPLLNGARCYFMNSVQFCFYPSGGATIYYCRSRPVGRLTSSARGNIIDRGDIHEAFICVFGFAVDRGLPGLLRQR